MTGILASSASRLETLAALVAGLEQEAREATGEARARGSAILDPDGPWFEIGSLRDHDREGADARGGILTGIGAVAGRPVVVAAQPTRGSRWSATAVEKLLRAQEIACRQRLPICYLLDPTAPLASPVDGWLPGGYGPGRALALAAWMRSSRRAAQIAACSGPQGGFSGLLACLAEVGVGPDEPREVRQAIETLPATDRTGCRARSPRPPALGPDALAALLPNDHRRSYDMDELLTGLFDGGEIDEFQPALAREMLCGHAAIDGLQVAVIANRRGVIPTRGAPPRIGGIIYRESASKVAFFIETASRQGLPMLFVHDVSGFMLGVEAEHDGIIRAGAELVEAMATAESPRIALTVNHASGAGYYAMAAQGFEPDFAIAWPTGRIGAMEAESAIAAAHGAALARAGGREGSAPPEVRASIAAMRESFERELGAVHAAARGHVDAIVTPAETRATVSFLFRVAARPRSSH
ncbi:MAG: carboxyl transferase domain-containing protein [Gemmatimonadales bacterium]